MSNLGHNSEAEIIRCINSKLEEFIESEQKFEKLQEELETKKEDEQEPILLDLGASLFEGKKFTEDPNCGVEGDNPNQRFNAWVCDNFPNLLQTFETRPELAALIWSAEHRDDYWDIKERYPRARTIRGRHAKWKKEQNAKKKPDEEPDDGDDVVDNDDTGEDTPDEDTPETGKDRKGKQLHVPPYSIEDSMGCIAGVAMSYCKDYEGTNEEAADILFGFVTKGCEGSSIRMSIARDQAKWLLELKKVMDLVEPKLHEFLEEEPKLNVVK